MLMNLFDFLSAASVSAEFISLVHVYIGIRTTCILSAKVSHCFNVFSMLMGSVATVDFLCLSAMVLFESSVYYKKTVCSHVLNAIIWSVAGVLVLLIPQISDCLAPPLVVVAVGAWMSIFAGFLHVAKAFITFRNRNTMFASYFDDSSIELMEVAE